MTKLSRRGLFGAAAGAAVAGPAAVKSVLDAAPSDYASLQPVPYVDGSVSSYIDREWIQKELEDTILQKAKTTEKPIVARSIRPEHFRIDGLRSVSPQQRARLMSEATAKFERENQLSYIDERIADFKEKLGILGQLF